MAARRARRVRVVRHQRHPSRRGAGQRHRARRLPDTAHRSGASRAARRTGVARSARRGHRRRRVVGSARGGRTAGPASRGRPDRHVHDDLHLGHQRRTQGGPDNSPDRYLRRRQPDRPFRGRFVRRLLPVDAAVSLQCLAGRLERGGRLGLGDGAGNVLRVRSVVGPTTLRRDLHELRRQAVGLRTGHSRAGPTMRTTRCGSRSATRPATAISPNSVGVSVARSGTASARAKARSSSPARTAARPARWDKAFRVSASTTPTPSPNARWPNSTTTAH